MKHFFSKYYKPWSFCWLLQRTLLKFRNFHIQDLSLLNIWNDYKLTRRTRKSLRAVGASAGNNLKPDLSTLIKKERDEAYTPRISCKDEKADKLSLVNSFFDHVYVVNLERKVERRIRMEEKLTRLHIRAEIFPAEDGYSEVNLREYTSYLNSPIDPEGAHEKELRLRRKVIYTPGAWGTLKTYYRLIQDARRRGFKRILSLEDDLVFIKEFEAHFKVAAKSLPDEWKLLYLGASQHSWKEGIDLITPAPQPSGDQHFSYYHPLAADGAFAIGIDASVYDLLLSEIEKMNCPFDSGPLQHITKSFPAECFVVTPNLVIANVSESENMINRRISAFARRVRWDLKRYDFG